MKRFAQRAWRRVLQDNGWVLSENSSRAVKGLRTICVPRPSGGWYSDEKALDAMIRESPEYAAAEARLLAELSQPWETRENEETAPVG